MRQLSEKHCAWLEERAIDVEVAIRKGLYSARKAPKADNDDEGFQEPIPDARGLILVFPYLDADGEVNAKFRAPGKRFYQRPGSRKTFWNAEVLDRVELQDGRQPLVITEGELDALVSIQEGHEWTVSCPDGAPADVDANGRPIPMKPDRELNPEDDPKFEYVFNNWERLSKVKRFILATDDDGPGRRLREELARRLGRVRCWTVDYPAEERVPIEDGFGKRAPKDLNEVRQHFGSEAVRLCLQKARPFPVMGLYGLDDFMARDERETYPIGIPDLDGDLRLYDGAFLVVSGIPGHGKSAFVDQVAFNMAAFFGWPTAIATFEEDVSPDLRNKLTSFYTRKPRHSWTARDRADADAFIRRYFCFITDDPHGGGDDVQSSVDWLIDRAVDAVIRFGIRLLIVDPWNEIDHKRWPGEMRDEYTARAIRALKRFGKQYGVAVIVVVHPTKEAGHRALKEGEPMSVYDISDGAMWFNKAEFLVIVVKESPPNEVGRAMAKILVKKVKFHEAGNVCDRLITFDMILRMFNEGAIAANAPLPGIVGPQ